jgi:hypothetical protein
MQIQGGLAGYLAHCDTVHWDQELPEAAPQPVESPDSDVFTGIVRPFRRPRRNAEQLSLW